MPLLNFKELPQANLADGKQDTFELFARDFLALLGLKIVIGPDRGQDGGKDLIVEESRNGLLSNTKIRWLVSCKHKAHSGVSVLESDEQDILGRVDKFSCKGFIGFYSTILSAPYNRGLEQLRDRIEIEIFDNEEIERLLLAKDNGHQIIKRYFPESYKKISSKLPTNILKKYLPLTCDACGKDLIEHSIIDKYSGVFAFVIKSNDDNSEKPDEIVDFYCACKGKCDKSLERKYFNSGFLTKWDDISDIVIPGYFLRFILSILNNMRSGKFSYSDDSFNKIRYFLMSISQIVFKVQTQLDVDRVEKLDELINYFH